MSPFGRQCIRCGQKVRSSVTERCMKCNALVDRLMAGMAESGFMHHEIADEFGLTVDAVSQRLKRFRKRTHPEKEATT